MTGVRVVLLALGAGLVAAGCEGSADMPSGGSSQGSGAPATIEWVVDGDTVRLVGGHEVRLVQIDAPEARDDCYGRDATKALIELAPKGTQVRLERDPELDDADTYGRLLRYVLVDGRNVNVELVKRGAVSPYYFRNERGRYADELDDAVDEARGADRGLWAACPLARLEPGLGSVSGPASSQRR